MLGYEKVRSQISLIYIRNHETIMQLFEIYMACCSGLKTCFLVC